MNEKILGILAAVIVTSSAYGADFPTRPVTLMVGFPAGGANDVMARAVADVLSEDWGQPVVVENIPGATGGVALNRLSRASADGHTIAMATAAIMAVRPALTLDFEAEYGFDPTDDIAPVALLSEQSFMLVATKSLPVNTFEELLDYARENPGQLNYSTTGEGGTPHLIGMIVDAETGIEAQAIPYGGEMEALTAVIGEEVQLGYSLYSRNIQAQIESETVKPLVATAAQRLGDLPDVPILAEYPDLDNFAATTWFGIFAPAATSPDILAALNDAINEALDDPRVISRFESAGFTPTPMALAAFQDFVPAERARWQESISGLDIDFD
ncbi:Bug family tripartite tricarboxylate transporter substrate binding protein [Pelagibacterium sp.]|uniref:Bug family tripartite tricarboxylate transporter substrate binding protein n=1 Tax=Pelagibacterium sp. TaxID=1967288 RepID=UPI003A8FBE61